MKGKKSMLGAAEATSSRIAARTASTCPGSTTPNTARMITSSEIHCELVWNTNSRSLGQAAAAASAASRIVSP